MYSGFKLRFRHAIQTPPQPRHGVMQVSPGGAPGGIRLADLPLHGCFVPQQLFVQARGFAAGKGNGIIQAGPRGAQGGGGKAAGKQQVGGDFVERTRFNWRIISWF